MLVIRQWRAFKMLMDNGKMTNVSLKNGELAVQCPACPRPDYNLPLDWRTRDPKNR